MRGKAKREAVIDEAIRRIQLMNESEVDMEFAAIENGLEIRMRFIAEPFVELSSLRAGRS